MPYIDIASAFFAVILGYLTILSQTHFWQRKEYRWDRMRAFLFSPEGSLENHPWLIAFIATIGIGWIGSLFNNSTLAIYAGWIALILLAAHHSRRIMRQGIFRPDWTTKSRLVVVITLALTYLYYETTTPQIIPSLEWTTLLFLLPAITTVSVFISNIISNIQKKKAIEEASKYRTSLQDLTVVGITGSYGKTSTKYFLQQLLQNTDKNTVATKEHRNSDFTVAQDFLEQVNEKTDIYIAEMGAYRIGEIRALTDITKPSIGIITAIGNQHIDLFGSKKNILSAKWELIESLPKDGTAILNADDETLMKKIEKYSGNKVLYSMKEKADVYVDDLKLHTDRISCTLYIEESSKFVSIPLSSDGLLSSLLAAVAGAHALGTPNEKIFAKTQHIQPFERTMQLERGTNNTTIIDDSYSASEEGVLNALTHLNRFKSNNKFIVMVPLIELGTEASSIHERIGQALAKTSASIYIYGLAYKDNIEKGLRGHDKVEWFTDANALKEKVSEDIKQESVILLEGRIPTTVRESLLT